MPTRRTYNGFDFTESPMPGQLGAREQIGATGPDEGDDSGSDNSPDSGSQGNGQATPTVPDKFQNDDGTVDYDNLVKSYVELEKNTQRSKGDEELISWARNVAPYVDDINKYFEQKEQGFPDSKPSGDSGSQGQGFDTERFQDDFSKDPQKALQPFFLAQQEAILAAIDGKLNPITQANAQITQQLQLVNLRQKNPAFASNEEEFNKYAAELDLSDPNTYVNMFLQKKELETLRKAGASDRLHRVDLAMGLAGRASSQNDSKLKLPAPKGDFAQAKANALEQLRNGELD